MRLKLIYGDMPYGGAYIDDDSDMHSPLDKVVEPEDTFIVSFERNGFNANRCFVPSSFV